MIMPAGLLAQSASASLRIGSRSGDVLTRYCKTFLGEPANSDESVCQRFMPGFGPGTNAGLVPGTAAGTLTATPPLSARPSSLRHQPR